MFSFRESRPDLMNHCLGQSGHWTLFASAVGTVLDSITLVDLLGAPAQILARTVLSDAVLVARL
jgi:hypothetical protein